MQFVKRRLKVTAVRRLLPAVEGKENCVAHFPEVVRRHVGGHADGDAGGAIDQQVGETRRQDDGFALRVIKVLCKGDRLPIDVDYHLLCNSGQPRLRVAHGRRGIVIDGAEVALSINEGVAQRERLRETHEGLINGGIAVGVVLGDDITDDAGALAIRGGAAHALVVHGVEHTTLDRLETVTHVRQGARDNDAHRVVEVRLAHLAFNSYGTLNHM